MINVLIVDDEKKACTNLQNILYEYLDKSINVVGAAQNTEAALTFINTTAVDAILLDIEMPKENAIHFPERIAPFNFEVIFVTALMNMP